MLSFCRAELSLTCVVSETQTLNTRSCHLLEKLGYKLESQIELFGAHQSIYVYVFENIAIRKATAADAHDFAYVLCESWKAAYKNIITPEIMANNTDVEKRAAFFEKVIPSGKGQFFIAYDGDNPCGLCSSCASRNEEMNGWAEIVAIYALPEYWGCGLGKRLMDTAVTELKNFGYSKIMLWAFEANTRVRRFYEKYGFAFDGTYKDSGFANAKEVRYRLEDET